VSIDLSGAKWFKSSRSTGSRECVEIAHLSGGMVGIRDSKDATGPALTFAPAEWDAFVVGLNCGRFDQAA
jgi:hypothetical protein